MSLDEKMLAVGLQSPENTTDQATIKIFNFPHNDNKFRLLCQIGNLHNIDYIDFSMDNSFLMFCDQRGNIANIDLRNLKKVENDNLGMEVEWVSNGLKNSTRIAGLPLNQEKIKITQVVRVNNDSHIIVADQIGTLRVISYPPSESSEKE